MVRTCEEVKKAIKETLKPESEGIRVSGLRNDKTGVILTLDDEASWAKIVRHTKLADKELRMEAPTGRMPAGRIYSTGRELDKDQLVKLKLLNCHRS